MKSMASSAICSRQWIDRWAKARPRSARLALNRLNGSLVSAAARVTTRRNSSHPADTDRHFLVRRSSCIVQTSNSRINSAIVFANKTQSINQSITSYVNPLPCVCCIDSERALIAATGTDMSGDRSRISQKHLPMSRERVRPLLLLDSSMYQTMKWQKSSITGGSNHSNF